MKLIRERFPFSIEYFSEANSLRPLSEEKYPILKGKILEGVHSLSKARVWKYPYDLSCD